MTTLKTCSKCKEAKELDQFYATLDRGVRSHRNPCKACRRAYQRALKLRGPLYGDRNRHLIQTYGITVIDYNMMFVKQEGSCAICRSPETVRAKSGKLRDLCIDHDHVTGKIRSLLCSRCNFLVGHIEGSGSEVALKAIRYIENHANGMFDEED